MNQDQAKIAADHPSNRACDACRLHKVRCLPNNSASSPSKACQRCARTDRQCIFTAPQKRKQRKRTDTRVAELEREVQAMRTLFERKKTTATSEAGAQSTKPTSTSQPKDYGQNTSTGSTSSPIVGGVSWTPSKFQTPAMETGTPMNQQDWSPSAFSTDSDVIERGIVTVETAFKLFQTYMDDLYPHYPAVPFPPDTSAEVIRRTQPTLFLAVIAAGAAKTDPHLYSALNSEVLTAYAHRTVMGSEKSLELVKSMIISAVWYYPPGRFSQLKFYDYIHMAATMAMDIGLGTSYRKASRNRRGLDSNKPSPESDPDVPRDEGEMEKRRTFIVCYLITTGVSMSMRRPNMLRPNSWLNECIDYVATNANPYYLDDSLVAWANLLLTTDEICTAFSFDDPSNMANIAETRVQMTLTGFEKKLFAWKGQFEPTGTINNALMLAYHHTQLYLHEICMHDDHDPEDFQPPYRLEKVVSIQPEIQGSSSYIDAVAISISSAHGLLDLMLNMPVENLRALPIFNFVRMAFAIIVLTKLHISSKTPTSQIGAVLDPKMMNLGFYLERLMEKLGEAVGPMECRAPFTFLGLIMRLQIWYKSQEQDVHFRAPTELYKVLDECWLPPPPNVGKKATFTNEPMRLDQSAFTSQMDNIQSMGLSALATMQPLPNVDFDFGNLDVNQFLTFGGMDFNTNDNEDWSGMPYMNDVSIQNMMNDTQMADMYDWNPQDHNGSLA